MILKSFERVQSGGFTKNQFKRTKRGLGRNINLKPNSESLNEHTIQRNKNFREKIWNFGRKKFVTLGDNRKIESESWKAKGRGGTAREDKEINKTSSKRNIKKVSQRLTKKKVGNAPLAEGSNQKAETKIKH